MSNIYFDLLISTILSLVIINFYYSKTKEISNKLILNYKVIALIRGLYLELILQKGDKRLTTQLFPVVLILFEHKHKQTTLHIIFI